MTLMFRFMQRLMKTAMNLTTNQQGNKTMRIWRVTYGNDNGCNGQGVGYYATKREAKKLLPFNDETQMPHPTLELLDVPTTKAELIKLLNDETGPLNNQ